MSLEITSEVVGQSQPGGEATQVDPVKSFSFAGLHEKALAMMNGEGTPAAPAAEQATSVTPSEPAEQLASQPPVEEATNVDGASGAQLAQLKDTDLVEVTQDGKLVQMPWSQAKGGVMRQAHFTKSMQQLAHERRQFDSERASLDTLRSEHTALVGLLKNKELLKQFLTQQHPDLVAQAQAVDAAAAQSIDPNDIATVGQVEQVAKAYAENVQQMVSRLEKQLEDKEAVITQRIEDKQATARLATDINSTVKALADEHPYITKVVPNWEEVLRYNVAQMNPQTPAEAIDAFKNVFGGWVENFKATVAETTKQVVVAKQKLVQNNIQPPGGGQVQPQPTSFQKVNPMTGKTEVDWAALRETAMGMLGNK
jgi:hypothetical protein